MVVDDEPYIQELYKAMLPIAGHTIVDSAYNGQEAGSRPRARSSHATRAQECL